MPSLPLPLLKNPWHKCVHIIGTQITNQIIGIPNLLKFPIIYA